MGTNIEKEKYFRQMAEAYGSDFQKAADYIQLKGKEYGSLSGKWLPKDQADIVKGIGKALAVEMSSRGAKIVINGRNQEHLYRAYDELRGAGKELIAVPGDVTSVEDCQKLVQKTLEHYGKIDILINNAGMSLKGSVADQTTDIFKKVVDINLHGALNMTKAALPYILEQKGNIRRFLMN